WAKGMKMKRQGYILAAVLLTVSMASPEAAWAKKHHRHASHHHHARYMPVPSAALVVDADTGRVIYEKNAEATRYPASLTKMMTLYLTFDALKKGKLDLDRELPVSVKAAAQPQTNISLDKSDRLPVRTAIESVVVRSANDSAMVLAEALGKTEF